MSYLDMRSKGFQKAIKETGVKAFPRLGRGSFCAVYDKGSSVMKLTIDQCQYRLYGMKIDNPVFPRVIADHGQVGEARGLPLYLIETEKLQPLSARSQAFVVSLINKYLFHYPSHGAWATDTVCSAEALMGLSDERHFTGHLRSGFLDLAQFILDEQCTADFHKSNFMVRGGRIVLNDPVADSVKFPMI